MAMFLGRHKVFPSIQDKDEILTEEWMECAKGTVGIVELMGKQFSMTASDMKGNIAKVNKKFETDKEKFKKFRDILQDEKDNKKHKEDKSATVGGLWLKRGLEYLCELFSGIVEEHETSKLPGKTSDNSYAVQKACENAYAKTLKTYHGMATKMIVFAALKVSPAKDSLMKSLLVHNTDMTVDQLIDEIKVYEAALREYVILVSELFNDFGNEDKHIPSGKFVQEQCQ